MSKGNPSKTLFEYIAQGEDSRFHLFGEWHQVAGASGVIRSICGVVEKQREPDGLQTCHFHRGTLPAGENDVFGRGYVVGTG